MSSSLEKAVSSIENLFDGTRDDAKADGVTLVWSGGLDNHPDIPPALCDTEQTAIDLWTRELTKWAGKRLSGHELVWRVRPQMQRWRMTMENTIHLERFASDRFCVYSVAAIYPSATPDAPLEEPK